MDSMSALLPGVIDDAAITDMKNQIAALTNMRDSLAARIDAALPEPRSSDASVDYFTGILDSFKDPDFVSEFDWFLKLAGADLPLAQMGFDFEGFRHAAAAIEWCDETSVNAFCFHAAPLAQRERQNLAIHQSGT